MRLENAWVDEAACKGHTDVMYDGDLDIARSYCEVCPVRRTCASQVMREEEGITLAFRFGVRAYMTPEQRHSIEKRGGLRGRDPIAVVHGDPPVPDGGDNWSAQHDELAKKAVKWLVANVKIGEALPSQAAICRALKCNPQPLRRVMDALVKDGTVEQVSTAKGKRNNGSTLRYIRRGNPAVVGWRPPHLTG